MQSKQCMMKINEFQVGAIFVNYNQRIIHRKDKLN